ncbi:MAG: DEAD/DEAH box helicase [Coriobacteriia bacterium]|nr:DEAD/DEAH box helicase [Coriobacteriia bacterium]
MFKRDGFALDMSSGNHSPEENQWLDRFQHDKWHALFHLGQSGYHSAPASSLEFLLRLAREYFALLARSSDLELRRAAVDLEVSDEAVAAALSEIPFAVGSEHLTPKWVRNVYARLHEVFQSDIAVWDGSVESYFTQKGLAHAGGRLIFHLAERRNSNTPFAFLATYAVEGAEGAITHLKLKQALDQFQDNQSELLRIVSILERAQKRSGFVRSFIESGDLFHAVEMSAQDTYRFLQDVATLEELGIKCRTPVWWKPTGKRSRIDVRASLLRNYTREITGQFGLGTLVELQPIMSIDGTLITESEIRELLEVSDGLTLLKGNWVEVNHERLASMLEVFEKLKDTELTIADALRGSLSPIDLPDDFDIEVDNSLWLAEMRLTTDNAGLDSSPQAPDTFHADLRPYQALGFAWLCRMASLGFGACLADDMGLGKTVQVLALLEKLRIEHPEHRTLLIVPMSLLANWTHELKKFAPCMPYSVIHRSADDYAAVDFADLPFLSITTYGMIVRRPEFHDMAWNLVILDEAQAIKNPASSQAVAVKKLRRHNCIVMTGTPVENKLFDLWSLFDFLNPGLLGSAKEFASSEMRYKPSEIRKITGPFVLRRLKTDKTVIADLPEKNEIDQYVSLSKDQRILYQQIIRSLQEDFNRGDVRHTNAKVLTAISACKQVCNHPDQFLGLRGFDPERSGKFLALRQLCETIHDKRERVIVFTQYREITQPLADFLASVFDHPGLVFHGGLTQRQRARVLDEFQGDGDAPFIVMSIKAGGVGLNLTEANNVILFDRWWNPAVEQQAIDRVFRIGQTRDVMVHKMVVADTIEEKIVEVLRTKGSLADAAVGAGGGLAETLSIDDLVALLRSEIV